MSFARYPAYKDSCVEWLGEVPGHWGVKPIKHIGQLQGGAGFPHAEQGIEGEELQFHKVNALAKADTDGKLTDGENSISRATASRLGASIFPAGTLVFAKVGAALLLARIRELAMPSCIDNNMMGLMVNTETFETNFVRYAMTLVRFDLIANPGAVPSLNESQIGDYKLAIPAPKEQQAIATFLDTETAKIDGLMAEQRALVALLKEKRQAVISHAVTKGMNPAAPMKDSGVAWLGEVPGHWEVKRIKHLTSSFEQGWSPQCEGFPVESENEWGVLKVGCVNGGTFRPEENKTLPAELEPIPALRISAGDLLISHANTRELVGSTAVATRDYSNLLLCDKLYRARFHKGVCEPMFIGLYLGTNMARSQIELAATGASSSMVNIGQSIILEMDLGLPTFVEQHAIVEFINHQTAQLDTLTQEAQTAIALLQERRTALISAAVTGKMDVRAAMTA